MSVTVPLVSFDPSDVDRHRDQMADESAPKNGEAQLTNFSQVLCFQLDILPFLKH